MRISCKRCFTLLWTSLVAQTVECLPTIWETQVRSLGREDPLEKEMAIHSSPIAWKIPWMEEPGRPQSTGSQRVGHNWATPLSCLDHTLWLVAMSLKAFFSGQVLPSFPPLARFPLGWRNQDISSSEVALLQSFTDFTPLISLNRFHYALCFLWMDS